MKREKLDKKWEAFVRIHVIEKEGRTEVLVNGQRYMEWRTGDEVSHRLAVVQLYVSGVGKQEEIAKAFGMHVNSVYNYVNAYKEEGARGLMKQVSGPQEAWKLTAEMKFKILETAFRNRDLTLEEMLKVLEQRWKKKVSRNSFRGVLIENGLIKEEVRRDDLEKEGGDLFERMEGEDQLTLDSITTEQKAKSFRIEDRSDEDNEERSDEENREEKGKRYYSAAQRIYLEKLEQSCDGDYVEKGEYNAYGGGLLFVPMLKRYDFIGIIKRVIALGREEGYSLEEFCLTLFYFDLFRFESIENFKTVYPEEFGILIGKLTSPSIFTIRRFLHKVRKLKIGEELIEEFAKNYLRLGLAKYGALYIDGHFLPYYGMREITLGWNTIRERPMKGSYNFIGNDDNFNPLIFLVRSSSEDLLEKIPEMIRKVKKIGEGAGLEPGELTVIFDREGYSAELFRLLDDLEGEKIKFITWAKYSDKWVNEIAEEKFTNTAEVIYDIQKKEEIRYCEIEKKEMNKYGEIRAIAIQTGSQKKRSVIYTNDKNKQAFRIIQLICRRWGQENLIKALKLGHLIDYHPGYFSEELEDQPMVENPELEENKRRRSNLISQLHGLELKFAENTLDKTKDETIWKEIKIKEMETISQIAEIKSKITLINQEIEQLPKEVKYDDVHDEKLNVLDYEKKRFMDCIKVFAYHMEKKMCEILIKHYDKEKEISPLLHMIVNRGAHVRLVQGKIVVRLRRFKDPEVNYAARHLCEDLNEMKPVTLDRFHLPISYEVA